MSFLKTTAIQHLNASTPAINLDANGRVGIGTSSPGHRLHIVDSSSVNYCVTRFQSDSRTYDFGVGGSSTGSFSNALYVFDVNAGLERFKIDSSGRVTKPYQPFFLARNGDQSGDGITTNPFRFSNVIHNVGNHFVTSGTGAYTRFVAPVSGVYAFTANPGYKQTSVDFVCRAMVNGSVFTDMIRLIGYPNSHSGGCYGFNIYLNANDYVSLSSEGSTYHRNNEGVPNWFSGVLLG